MESRSYPYFDPEYETNCLPYSPPGVVIDNQSSDLATLVKVDSVNVRGILLEVVQVLTDLELTITKAHISYDAGAGYFMDVFHVTDELGRKVNDKETVDFIQQTLGTKKKKSSSTNDLLKCRSRSVGVKSVGEQTVIELTGKDRPGLLSEVSAVLTDNKCNVTAAEVWTHNLRVACVVYVTDGATWGPIEDFKKMEKIKEALMKVMRGSDDKLGAKTDFVEGYTHIERRLHQMMFADQDYEVLDRGVKAESFRDKSKPIIGVHHCSGYSLINVQCPDRPKLLFDIVCTLTDMQYVVFHATIDTSDDAIAVQDFYVRQLDGSILDSEAEERVKKCLEAAIERRSLEGLRLELCTNDRVGLLSDVTRLFRENGLSVTRADILTQGAKALNVFYVTDTQGNPPNMKIVESMRREIGQTILEVKEAPRSKSPPRDREHKHTSKACITSFLKSSEKFLSGLTNLYGFSSMGWKAPVYAS